MAFDELQQLHRLLENSKHLLLAIGGTQAPDAIAAALAFKKFLEKQNIQADIVCDRFSPSKNLAFLTGLDDIKPEFSQLQKFILKIDLSNAKIDTLSYDVKDGWLSIYITPKHGIISKNELRTAQSSFKYDLIITFGAQDLESLGNMFLHHSDMFYRIPIINIDNHPANEHFGQMNFVDIAAASASEIVFKLMEKLGAGYLDADIATCLLTGMISQTQSFKASNVKPDTLAIAGQLMNLGAEREKIVKNLYRTRSIASLKLWGLALTHLESDPQSGIVWSLITKDEFSRAGAGENDLNDLIEELITNTPEAKIAVLIYESEISGKNQIRCRVFADRQHDAKLLVQSYNPEGDKKTASFFLEGKTLKEAESEILNYLRKNLAV